MARKIKFHSADSYKNEFLKIFRELCYSRQSWEVWSDVITVMACSIANSTDRTIQYESREREYADCIKKLNGVEKPSQLLGIVVEALEANIDQDFLGSLYMELELGSHWRGQYFTPYNVSKIMSEITMGNGQKEIEKKGWISICDPCVGGGAMLIAAANTMREQNIDYQRHVLFVGQDIDRVVGMMAYIQLSLLGCSGYIVVGNSLTHPITGSVLFPNEQKEQEFWYMPMFCSEVWKWRKLFLTLQCDKDNQTKANKNTMEIKKEQFYMFFDFKNKEVQYGN